MKLNDMNEYLAEQAKLPGEQGDIARELLASQAAGEKEMERAEAAGEWDRAIGLADSQNRAAVLVKALEQTKSKKAARELLNHWFNLCDALAPWKDQLRAQFDRVGWVTDADEEVDYPVTIYRAGWADDDVEGALSWTTDLEVAKRFAQGLYGLRSRLILGTYREDVEAMIWQATCWDAYAYFDGRSEKEVVPKLLTDIEPILELQRVPKEVA
jgi:hypothetical protein